MSEGRQHLLRRWAQQPGAPAAGRFVARGPAAAGAAAAARGSGGCGLQPALGYTGQCSWALRLGHGRGVMGASVLACAFLRRRGFAAHGWLALAVICIRSAASTGGTNDDWLGAAQREVQAEKCRPGALCPPGRAAEGPAQARRRLAASPGDGSVYMCFYKPQFLEQQQQQQQQSHSDNALSKCCHGLCWHCLRARGQAAF